MPPTLRDPLPRLPLTPEVLDLKVRALHLYRDLTLRPELRAAMDAQGYKERRHQLLRTEGRRGAEILATELLELVASGATHPEVEALLTWIRAIAEDAFAAREGRDLPPLLEAELAEHEADTSEDRGQATALRILASGKHLTKRELEDRLRVTRRQTAAGAVLVRALESELRRRTLGLYDRRSA